jgi:aerobic carbon-monoxide dehydrogenase medium subunit
VKPAPVGYSRPQSVADAIRALADLGPEAKVLAGGQSLVPLMSLRLARPEHLVDINRLAELSYINVTAGHVAVGALTRHAALLASAAATTAQPLLGQALRCVAHPAIRNRGTTVGSLTHADPAGEMPAVLALLDGSVQVASSSGERLIPAAGFFLGPLESALEPDELAVEARFPVLAPGSGTGFAEISRRRGDYAICGVAVLASVTAQRTIGTARAAYLSVGPVPMVLDLTEAVGGEPADPDARYPRVRELAAGQIRPDSDIHATAGYRRQVAGVLTERALRAAVGVAVRGMAGEPA